MRMRTMLSMSTLAAALCTATTLAGGSNCCVPNGGLGCDDPTCQAAVCGLDTFCCTTQWDAICASEAASLCADLCNGGGGGVCGTGGDCCTASGGLGCNDVTCCESVCAVDSFCCATAWDGICASEAASLCADLCGGGGGVCGSGGDCCTANGGLGCNDVTCCETVCAVDSFCCATAWDGICASEAGSLCADLCGGGGGGCGTGGDCCTASGGIGCNDVTCCETVCAIDSFCCAVAWDTICASEAGSLCADLCGGGGGCGTGGDCCTASGGLGCNDVTCCETVCAVDSFCCAVAWDGICASEAASICSDLCGGSVCLGDFDSNGVVDAADLAVLLGGWNGAGSTDLDGNGTTDAADLALLLGAWGACP